VPRLLALLVSLVIVLSGVMTCIPMIREKALQKQAQLRLADLLRHERERTVELQKQLWAAKHDPAVVEKLAREKFGLGRPGEIIFKFRDDLPPAATP
jgi:hypothetical protein